jgi:hypothetical protein
MGSDPMDDDVKRKGDEGRGGGIRAASPPANARHGRGTKIGK